MIAPPDADAAKPTWRTWARGLGPVGHEHRICLALAGWLPHGAIVGAYLALPDEVALEHVFTPGTEVALPRLRTDGELEWHVVSWQRDQLTRAGTGVREPSRDAPVVPAEALDVVLVPGRVFDRVGIRLGRGGGHYDRALARLRPGSHRVGVVPDARVVARLPHDPHDVPMSHLATEHGVAPVADPGDGRPGGR